MAVFGVLAVFVPILQTHAADNYYCGAPSYDSTFERASFLWKDCDGAGDWYLRVTGGGASKSVYFDGQIQSTGGLTNLKKFSIEATDMLDIATGSEPSNYRLKVSGAGSDGLNFQVSANACFIPREPASTPVYIGATRMPLTTSTFDMTTGLACSLPDVGLTEFCGAPGIDPSADRATFLWQDCDGSGIWHLRVTGGDTSKLIYFGGSIWSAGGVASLTEIGIETTDELDFSGSNTLSYRLKIWGSSTDGLDFSVSPGACFTHQSPSNLPVLLGANRLPLTSQNLDMSTGLACLPLDSDQDGLSDAEELQLGTNPLQRDSDGGGVGDADEIAAGTRPTQRWDDKNVIDLSVEFQDVSIAAGIKNFASESWGAAWGNLDGDIYPDLFMSNHRNPGRLFRNDKGRRFHDVSVAADQSNAFSASTWDSHGAVWSDVDNDGDQDLAIAIGAREGLFMLNDDGVLIEKRNDLGLNLGIIGEQRMPLFLDFNNDGLLDLKVIDWFETGSRNTVFRQSSSNKFWKAAGSAGLRCELADWAQLVDINGSGTPELLCAGRSDFPSIVYDYSSGVGIRVPVPATSMVSDSVTADFDGDLRSDLLLVRGRQRIDQIYQVDSNTAELHALINFTGTRTFRIETAGALSISLNSYNWNFLQSAGSMANVYIGASGYNPASGYLHLNPADFQNLGSQDPAGRNGLFIGYEEESAAWELTFNTTRTYSYAYLIVDSSESIASVSAAGLDAGDKRFKPKLMLNSDSGLVNATSGSGLEAELCVSAVAGDFDNDMDQDLFLACRNGARNLQNVFYENQGSGQFKKVNGLSGAEGFAAAALTGGGGNSESVIVADYDVDGFLDLLVTNGLNMRPKGIGGEPQLFHNLGNANNWIEIDLQGVKSNRDGVGAKVLVTVNGKTQYREQSGGYHRWSQNHSRIHIGLGSHQMADTVTVYWPSGITDTYNDVAANKLYRLTENQGLEVLK